MIAGFVRHPGVQARETKMTSASPVLRSLRGIFLAVLLPMLPLAAFAQSPVGKETGSLPPQPTPPSEAPSALLPGSGQAASGMPGAVSGQGATANGSIQAIHLRDVVERVIQMRHMFEILLRDPAWPLQESPADDVDDAKLACIRAYMPSAVQQTLLDRATAYLRDHPSRLRDDLRLLEGGGGTIFARVLRNGMDSKPGAAQDRALAAISAETKPDDVRSMYALMVDARNEPLRELMGIGRAVDPHGPHEDDHLAGQLVKNNLGPMLAQVKSACGIPDSSPHKEPMAAAHAETN